VAENESSQRPGELIALAAAICGAVILWLAREVMPADVALRIVLTLLWLAVWTLAAFGPGAAIMRWALDTDRLEAEDIPVALLTGAGVLAAGLAYLALMRLYRPWILVAILLVAAAAGLFQCRRIRHVSAPKLESRVIAVAALIGLAALALVPVLAAPPVMYDTLNYHLAFPSQWLKAGGFVEFPRHGFSYYPSSYGVLYGFALATVGAWGATAIHFWFGALAAAVAAVLGRRLGGARTAVWAAACFVLTPAVLEVGTYASADLAVAAWGGAAVASVLPLRGREWSTRSWIVGGLLLGCAVASKYLAGAVILVPWLVTAAVGVKRAGVVRSLPAWAAAAALPVLPWAARNVVWTGNPVYPYLQAVFGGPETGMSVGGEILKAGETAPGTAIWAAQTVGGLALRTVEPLRQGGLLGPHWLLLLLVAAALFAFNRTRSGHRSLEAAMWTYTGIGLLAWGSLVQMARFLLPVLVVAAPLAGAAAVFLTSRPRRLVRWSFSLLLLTILVWNSTMIATRQNIDRLGYAAGQISGREYLERWASYAPVLDHLNNELPPASRVLFVAEPRSLYVEPSVVVEDPFQVPLLVELATHADSEGDLAQQLLAGGITHVLVNSNEMPLSATLRGVDDYWAPSTARQRQILDRFFTSCVVRTAGTPQLWVGRITPPADGS
jgi:hypothetical protein